VPVTVNQTAGQRDPTNGSLVAFEVRFGAPVTGFTGSDVSFAGSTVGGTLVASLTTITAANYIVTVTGMNGTGTVVASMPAGAAFDAGGNATAASTSTDNTVSFDNVAPTVVSRAFNVGAPPYVDYVFSEAVGALAPADLNLVNITTGLTIPAGNIVLNGFTTTTRRFRFTSPGGALPDGNYRLTITGRPTDDAGNPLNAGAPLDFFLLAGDINRDRSVNGSDFAILAANFGSTGRSYAQGDLNGDGAVTGADFAILAGNFGKSLPVPPALRSAVASPGVRASSAAPAASSATPSAKLIASRPRRARTALGNALVGNAGRR
jgi:Dockerin type I domain